MKLYSYIVARDYGFAPNPFYGFCTLATCKPHIRNKAIVGDWIVGTGAVIKYNYSRRLIYAMQVSEVMDFDNYWNDKRFVCKRPVLNGSLKQLYGDNIYHRKEGAWVQADSHHSLNSGVPNESNIRRDTQKDRVLIGSRFVYYGASAPVIPDEFMPFKQSDEFLYKKTRNYRVLSNQIAQAFDRWMDEQNNFGLQGMPLEFNNHPRQ